MRSIENAIEEIVRFCGPTALLARQATRDVQVNATDRVRRQTPLEVCRWNLSCPVAVPSLAIAVSVWPQLAGGSARALHLHSA